jgi:putative membrane protein
MLKQLAFSTVLLMSSAAFAQHPAPAAAPGATMAPATAAPAPAAAPMQPPTGATASTTTTKLSAGDKKFVDKVASGNSAEIQVMTLAGQKASDQKIKDMAAQMLTDHQDAGQKLTALAQQKGIEVPTDLSAADQKEVDKFNKLDGKKFDKAFLKDETKDHKGLLAVLKKESTSGKDPDLKSFADSISPTVQKHLDMLENKGS